MLNDEIELLKHMRNTISNDVTEQLVKHRDNSI